MRIIKKKEVWKMKVTCTGNGVDNAIKKRFPCGSELEAEATDLFMNYSIINTKLAFECPECGCITRLTEEEIDSIPEAIVKYAKQFYYDDWKKLQESVDPVNP